MEQNGKLNPSQLLRDLEENEQEIFAAGQNVSPFGNSDFFYQSTDIMTEADNELNLSGGDSGSQKTKYIFSQITMGYSIAINLPNIWKQLQRIRQFFG